MADISEIRTLNIRLEVLQSDNEGLEKRLRGAAEKIEGQQAAYVKVRLCGGEGCLPCASASVRMPQTLWQASSCATAVVCAKQYPLHNGRL